MLRYEVMTPLGYMIGVPKKIWRAWPASHRRLMDITREECRRLAKQEAAFDCTRAGHG